MKNDDPREILLENEQLHDLIDDFSSVAHGINGLLSNLRISGITLPNDTGDDELQVFAHNVSSALAKYYSIRSNRELKRSRINARL